ALLCLLQERQFERVGGSQTTSRWNTNARGPRYRPAEARSRGGSHHPTSRVRSSFATTLPSELAQCTSRSRSRLDGIDDVAHRRREAPAFAQHRGLATYEEHNDLV